MPRYPQGDNWRDDRDQNLEFHHSIQCRVWNRTGYTFRWEDFRLQDYSNFLGHGPFFDHKREIHPGNYADIRMIAQKDDRGVEVWVTYNTDVGPVEFHFNNPFVGENSYHTYRLPAEFISVHNSGQARPVVWEEARKFPGMGNVIYGDHPSFEWTIKQRE